MLQDQDDHEFIAAEFLEFQKEVTSLTQLTKSFFEKLVAQLEQGLDNIDAQYGAFASA